VEKCCNAFHKSTDKLQVLNELPDWYGTRYHRKVPFMKGTCDVTVLTLEMI